MNNTLENHKLIHGKVKQDITRHHIEEAKEGFQSYRASNRCLSGVKYLEEYIEILNNAPIKTNFTFAYPPEIFNAFGEVSTQALDLVQTSESGNGTFVHRRIKYYVTWEKFDLCEEGKIKYLVSIFSENSYYEVYPIPRRDKIFILLLAGVLVFITYHLTSLRLRLREIRYSRRWCK